MRVKNAQRRPLRSMICLAQLQDSKDHRNDDSFKLSKARFMNLCEGLAIWIFVMLCLFACTNALRFFMYLLCQYTHEHLDKAYLKWDLSRY